jgi:hypothetical protein
MRIHGVVWYFSAKTLLVAVLLYYFVAAGASTIIPAPAESSSA